MVITGTFNQVLTGDTSMSSFAVMPTTPEPEREAADGPSALSYKFE
jgi:hypothetical protein